MVANLSVQWELIPHAHSHTHALRRSHRLTHFVNVLGNTPAAEYECAAASARRGAA